MQKTDKSRCPEPHFSAMAGAATCAPEENVPHSFFLHLAVLLGVALVVGVYLIATSVLICRDGVFYVGQAQELARDPRGAAQRYPAGYCFLLLAGHEVASAFVESDSAVLWAASSQAVTLLCRLGAVVFLYLLGRFLVGGRRSFWAVLILIVLPYPAQWGSNVLREWPFVLFLAAGFWLLLRALREQRWWLFALVGLVAGLGYWIRPMSGQLILYGLLGLAVAAFREQPRRRLVLPGTALLLLLSFALPVAAQVLWTGKALPDRHTPVALNAPPAITAVGGSAASHEPLRFEIGEGAALDVSIEASDPDGDALTFSAATIPLGTRPVYRFRYLGQVSDFWTISAREKRSLLAAVPRAWSYEGIDFYAYAESEAAPGLVPVHRLWSSALGRHFFTIDASELETVLTEDRAALWQREAVAFHVFPPGRQPAGAVPVHRFRDDVGHYYWLAGDPNVAAERFPDQRLESDGIAWYACPAGPPPAGCTWQSSTFQWRPGPNHRGEHQVNLIVSDGQVQSCQLIQVNVGLSARRAGAAPNDSRADIAQPIGSNEAGGESAPRRSTSARFLIAANEILANTSETLMVFFFVPLCLGLYHRLRHTAGPYERVLVTAVIAVNVALMFVRYVWIEPELSRRYCLGLVALTAYGIGPGLELMARGVRLASDRVFGDRGRGESGERIWFHVLVAVGVAICLPKLLRPLGAGQEGYRATALWLRNHTAVDDVVAVPDTRISFYADRVGLYYRSVPVFRASDSVVVLVDDDSPGRVPAGWTERYSSPVGALRRGRLVVYQQE